MSRDRNDLSNLYRQKVSHHTYNNPHKLYHDIFEHERKLIQVYHPNTTHIQINYTPLKIITERFITTYYMLIRTSNTHNCLQIIISINTHTTSTTWVGNRCQRIVSTILKGINSITATGCHIQLSRSS